ncbi:MAG: TatD family deoxyribonuclease [Deltaproteobacteria bacterium]|nr:TatD family deoxyribonuclease [Deltaproteobacteria bacterium]
MLADSHAHLDMPEFAPDQAAVVARATEAGVALIINVGIGLENSSQVLATARKFPGVFATVGVHPHGVKALTDGDLEALSTLARDPKVVAVGEIGLDFYRRRSPEEVQRQWFRRQLEWASGLGQPVVIHTRNATAATLEILRDHKRRLHGGVMHCFGGSYEEARAFLDLGLHLSFSGTLTYPAAGPLREVAKKIPLDRVLVETDAPYLPPQPWRGKRNEPAYVAATARLLAELNHLSFEEVARLTFQNTLTAFDLDVGAQFMAPETARPHTENRKRKTGNTS